MMEKEPFSEILKPLFSLGGIAGVAVIREGGVVFNSLPYQEAQSKVLMNEVAALFQGYRTAGRSIGYIVFHWDDLTLVLHGAGTVEYVVALHQAVVLNAVIGMLPGLDDAFARTLREIDVSKRQVMRIRLIPWAASLRTLEGALSKVVSDSQAKKMIERKLVLEKIDVDRPALQATVERFAMGVFANIGHKTKQKLLLSEFDAYLKTLN